MRMIQILEQNTHHEGKVVMAGCINHAVTDLIVANMANGTLPKRDVDFFIPVNQKGWQRWYDSSLTVKNVIEQEANFYKKKNIYTYNFSNISNIGILVAEAPDSKYAIDLIHKLKPYIKKTGLILVPYKNNQIEEFVGALNHEFDTQDLGHMENFSYINFIKGKVPLNKNKKVGRTQSALT